MLSIFQIKVTQCSWGPSSIKSMKITPNYDILPTINTSTLVLPINVPFKDGLHLIYSWHPSMYQLMRWITQNEASSIQTKATHPLKLRFTLSVLLKISYKWPDGNRPGYLHSSKRDRQPASWNLEVELACVWGQNVWGLNPNWLSVKLSHTDPPLY